MKYNQKKKKENIEIFLFIMVMAVFAAVLGVMSLGEKMQPVNQIMKISSGWYYYDNGKRTEVTLPDTIQAEEGEELILYNDGITDLDAGKVVTTRGAQYDLKIWLGDRPIYAGDLCIDTIEADGNTVIPTREHWISETARSYTKKPSSEVELTETAN